MAGSKSPSTGSSPLQFHWQDWKEILLRVKSEVDIDQISIVAAAIAYYALFALFPLLIATVSVYGLFADPAAIEQQINATAQFIPRDAAQVIGQQLHAIVQNSDTSLGLSAILSIFVAIWTASSGMKALMTAINIAYDEKEKRGFIKRTMHALFLTLGAILSIILAVTLIAIVPAVLKLVGLQDFSADLLLVLRWPMLALLFILGLAVVNRIAPSRNQPKWRWVSVGAVVATGLILIASLGLAVYVDRFGSYNKTYGSLAGVVILLLWLYIVAYAVLFGVELNAEIEHQTLVDSTVGPAKPMGQRGAVMADTVPYPTHGDRSR